MYKALDVTKQGFHQYLKRLLIHKSDEEDLHYMIGLIRVDHPTMSCRSMYFKIKPDFIGRDNFETFCRDNGFMSKKYKNQAKTTDSMGVTRFPDLLEGLLINKMNQVWQSDITYFDLDGIFYYITFIIDAYTRKIVGHKVSKGLKTVETTIPALLMAIKSRKGMDLTELIFHSDGGGQYYAKEFRKITQPIGIQSSMCKFPWENGKAERINGIIKNNYLIHKEIKTLKQLIKEVDQSVFLYNNEKPHIALKRMTPFQFENLIISKQDLGFLGIGFAESLRKAKTQILA